MDDRIMAMARYVGRAMARDVIGENMPREWTGLDPQDADVLAAFGPRDEEMWSAVQTEAMAAYDDAIEVQETAEMLEVYGDMYTGSTAADEARDWVDHGFTSVSADPWCAVGVWDASTAADLRDAGLSPDAVQAAAESLTDGMEGKDVLMRYTGGGPIYAACNGDLTARDAIIYEAQRLASH